MKVVRWTLSSVVAVALLSPCPIWGDDLAEKFRSISSMLNGHIAIARPEPKPQVAVHRYQKAITKAGTRWQIDPLLIASIIRHESAFNPDAVSQKGACGLMQLMPETAKEMGVTAIFDPYQNINGGTRYIRMMHDRYRGDLFKTLLAYNAGPTRVDTDRIPEESKIYANNVLNTYYHMRRHTHGP
jgi:soluble lytic murein transglycosylase-like protein